MKISITGSKRYLIAAILFGVLGVIFSIRDIVILYEGETPLTLIFSVGMVGFAVIIYKMYEVGKKKGVDILGEPEYDEYGKEVRVSFRQESYSERVKDLKPRNKVLLQLYVGYVFTWLGAAFAFIGFATDIAVAAILGSIFFIIALPSFITSFKYYINPTEKNIKAVSKAVNFLVIVAIIMGVSPIFVLIAGLYASGYYVAFFIIIGIIFFVAWLIIRAQIKKRKKNTKEK